MPTVCVALICGEEHKMNAVVIGVAQEKMPPNWLFKLPELIN